jgi:hypothetical protein
MKPQIAMIDPSSVRAYFPELCSFELVSYDARRKSASGADTRCDVDEVAHQQRNQLRFVEGRLQAVGFICELSHVSCLGTNKGLSRSRKSLWRKVLYFMTK